MRDKIGIAVAKSSFLYQAVKMSPYGSLININPSASNLKML